MIFNSLKNFFKHLSFASLTQILCFCLSEGFYILFSFLKHTLLNIEFRFDLFQEFTAVFPLSLASIVAHGKSVVTFNCYLPLWV